MKEEINQFREKYGSSIAWISNKIGIDRSILSTYLSSTATRELNKSQIDRIEEGWKKFITTLKY